MRMGDAPIRNLEHHRQKFMPFQFDKTVMDEFGLDTQYLDVGAGWINDYTDHVDQNRKVLDNYKDITKIVHLVKIKQNMVNQLQIRKRHEQQVINKLEKSKT